MKNNNLIYCTFSIFITCSAALPHNESVVYDQRQTGDYNIHISLKDIKIVALLNGGLGSSEDYDYNYDYSELTIKPPANSSNTTDSSTNSSTTASPTTTENDSNVTTTTEKIVEITPNPQKTTKATTTEAILDVKNGTNETITPKPNKAPPPSQDIPVAILFTPVEVTQEHVKPAQTTKKPTKVSSTTTTTTSSPSSSTTITSSPASSSTTNKTVKTRQAGCIEGYVKDRQGICRPRVRKPQQQSLLRKLIQLSQRPPLL